MALIVKHHEVSPELVARIQENPDAATTPAEIAVLAYLTTPDEDLEYPLGRFTLGKFAEGKGDDALHTGSVFDGTYQEIARGGVEEDTVNPDGIYQVYVPI